MDQSQEEMKSIGSLGIITESFKTIITWKKIFAQITLTLILPLTIVFLVHMEMSHRLFHKIERDPYELFSGASEVYSSYRQAQVTSADWLYYLLFKAISITTLTVFALLSTAAVVYTVASIYTSRDVTCRRVMKVVPKVWKRLIVTFLCMFLAFLAYNLIAAGAFFLWNVAFSYTVITAFVLLVIFILYIFGFLYMSIVWQLASVVSVLESSYGLKAMIKGMDLVKGKRRAALTVFFLLYALLIGVVLLYMVYVEYNGGEMAMVWRVMIGILCSVLLLISFLLLIVTQTVLYVVCKTHHRETIDKLSLSTYLGAYLGEPQPSFKVGEDIQLGRPQPQPVVQV